MTTFSYTTGNPSNLVGGGTASMNDIAGPLTDLRTFLNGSVDGDNLTSTAGQQLGLSSSTTTRRGKFIQATSGTTSSGTYGALTNGPDRVSSIVLPTDGLIHVCYTATWFLSGAATANAAIFIGGTQLQGWTEDTTALVALEAVLSTTKINALVSHSSGLVSTNGAVNNLSAPATTGQAVSVTRSIGGNPFTYGGYCLVEAAAGTYNVDVQFKTSASTLNVASRKLKVFAISF